MWGKPSHFIRDCQSSIVRRGETLAATTKQLNITTKKYPIEVLDRGFEPQEEISKILNIEAWQSNPNNSFKKNAESNNQLGSGIIGQTPTIGKNYQLIKNEFEQIGIIQYIYFCLIITIAVASLQNISDICIMGNINGIRSWLLPQHARIRIVKMLHTTRRGIREGIVRRSCVYLSVMSATRVGMRRAPYIPSTMGWTSPRRQPNGFNRMRTKPCLNKNWEKDKFPTLKEPGEGILRYYGT